MRMEHIPSIAEARERRRVNGHAPANAHAGPAAEGTGADPRDTVARLAALPDMEVDRLVGGEARRLGCRVSTLRGEVAEARAAQVADAAGPATGGGRPLSLPDREPWPRPVDGAEVLDGLADALRRHVVMGEAEVDATALWIAFTYALDRFDHAARLRIRSPEKRCGKSTLLDLLMETCARPLPVNNITPAALFRSVEVARPTLLIDEADTFMRDNEELRGIVNSGHRRSLAFVVRNVEVGGEHQPCMFSTWAAIAIAGIGALHGTVEDRSVAVELKRKLPSEKVERLDRAARARLGELARRLARWAADAGPALDDADPATPAGLNDRAADNWRPLLALADAAGGAWPERARRAAVTLSGGDDGGDSLATDLLADVKGLFEAADEARGEPVAKLSSSWIVAELAKLEHRPWPEMPGSGRPLTARKLAALLARFGVTPKHDREGNVYRRHHFAEAWDRYAAGPVKLHGTGEAVTPEAEASQPSQASKISGLAGRQSFTVEAGVKVGDPANPLDDKGREACEGSRPGEVPSCRVCGMAVDRAGSGWLTDGDIVAHTACVEREGGR